MDKYRLSKVAKEDLIRIHQSGTAQFGEERADKYLNVFFDKFDFIAERPYAFESAEFINEVYGKYVCGVDTIFCRIEKEMVEIMTIIGRQDGIESFKQLS